MVPTHGFNDVICKQTLKQNVPDHVEKAVSYRRLAVDADDLSRARPVLFLTNSPRIISAAVR